jgi:hypothetical protein
VHRAGARVKIIVDRPPNYAAIVAAFPFVATHPAVYFCWGSAIYSPSGHPLTPSLIAHEEVHSKQQDGRPQDWWDKYLVDPKFRFDQELEAHRIEYQWFGAEPRNRRRIHLRGIARRLASPLYGGLTTVHQAKRLISREGAD